MPTDYDFLMETCIIQSDINKTYIYPSESSVSFNLDKTE